MSLPPPTIVDLIDAAVRASNNLIIYAHAADAPALNWWATLVEADYGLNVVQDIIHDQEQP